MATALLFDERSARDVDLAGEGDTIAGSIAADNLLWIDLSRSEEDEISRVAGALGVPAGIRSQVVAVAGRPSLRDEDAYLHLTALAAGGDDGEVIEIDCVVGELWLLTVHSGTVEAIREFRERVEGRGEVGTLDTPTFLADLLEWVVGGYIGAFEEIEDELEEADVAAIRAADDEIAGWVEKLVRLRQRAGRLRRALAAHRPLLVALTHPELDALSSESSAERFAALVEQLDRALDLATATRESVLGSFELLVARAGHRTNEIMKVLTVVSVLILPATALAGIMGMNFKAGVFRNPVNFWYTIVAMAAVAVATLVAARLRRWI